MGIHTLDFLGKGDSAFVCSPEHVQVLDGNVVVPPIFGGTGNIEGREARKKHKQDDASRPHIDRKRIICPEPMGEASM